MTPSRNRENVTASLRRHPVKLAELIVSYVGVDRIAPC